MHAVRACFLSLLAAVPRQAEDRSRGSIATEYALLASFVAVGIIALVTLFGTQVAALFQSAVTAFGG